MKTSRVFILLTLLSEDEKINVGQLIAQNLKDMVASKKTTLGHSCLINLLCEKEWGTGEPSDIFVKSQGAINVTKMMVYEKYHDKYLRGLRQQGVNQDVPEEKPQMMEEDMFPQNLQHKTLCTYFVEYVYGMGNWAHDASSQMLIAPPYFPQQFNEAPNQYR
jgi:hypothetical protein